MSNTVLLELPFILPAQAQKHVTHNDALTLLDALAQLSLKSRSVIAPPVTPAVGDRYLIPFEATGAWSGHGGEIGIFVDGAWTFRAPREGFLAWIEDEGRLNVHAEGDFEPLPQIAGVDVLGVNATPDETNRLAVRAPASLFDHETGSHRLSVNKAATVDTASIQFKKAYSARAELGLNGSDDFSIKTSADGVNFQEVMAVRTATGKVEFTRNLYPDGAVFNIMRDGGRFSGTPEPSTITVSTYATPPWVALSNGATLTAHAKFIRDSSTYGGAGAALDTHIQDLMTLLLESAQRRLYPEFHVARLTAGSGTDSPVVFPDSITRHTQLYTQGFGRPVKLTTSCYVKATAGDIGVPWDATRRLFIDGVEKFARSVIPSDGAWHHVLVLEGEDFSRHYRYSYDAIRFYQRSGDVALLAFPAAVPGQIRLPVNVGQIPGTALW